MDREGLLNLQGSCGWEPGMVGEEGWDVGEEGWDVGQESLLTKWVGLLPTLFQMVGKAHGAQRAWEQVLSPPCSLPSTLRASVSPCT